VERWRCAATDSCFGVFEENLRCLHGCCDTASVVIVFGIGGEKVFRVCLRAYFSRRRLSELFWGLKIKKGESKMEKVKFERSGWVVV
jgi:hypothetical protein